MLKIKRRIVKGRKLTFRHIGHPEAALNNSSAQVLQKSPCPHGISTESGFLSIHTAQTLFLTSLAGVGSLFAEIFCFYGFSFNLRRSSSVAFEWEFMHWAVWGLDPESFLMSLLFSNESSRSTLAFRKEKCKVTQKWPIFRHHRYSSFLFFIFHPPQTPIPLTPSLLVLHQIC